MVVKSRSDASPQLDLGHLGYFLGLRVNQLVMDRMRAAGFQHVRESHGYVIQHLVEQDRSITELAQRLEVTQQAASKTVAELAEIGIVELTPGDDRRAKTVKLSDRGWAGVRLARRVRRQIEGRLIRAAGAARYAEAKAIMADCLKALGGMERVRTRRVLPPE
jgi:DNA-binding MarR family transcriptional regulator